MDAVARMPVRTLLVSDDHLGNKHAQAQQFLEFLCGFSPESIYIVGDFIDAWRINSGWYWSETCDAIIDQLIELANKHTKIFYIPGNHDAFLRKPAFRVMLPERLPEFEVADEFIFETLGGYRLLVTHGDRFDFFETRAQWVSKRTTGLYDACLSLNWWFHRLMRNPRENPYRMCARLKERVKRGVRFISNFESQIMRHAHLQSCHGVICGHIHTPDMVQSESMLYFNTGDWMENCTGLVEHHDGNIELVSRYTENRNLRLSPRSCDANNIGDARSTISGQPDGRPACDGVAA